MTETTMPLTFTGRSTSGGGRDCWSLQAHDDHGAPVVVKASDKAMQDYGVTSIKKVASAKFDRRAMEQDGSVSVHTTDCQ